MVSGQRDSVAVECGLSDSVPTKIAGFDSLCVAVPRSSHQPHARHFLQYARCKSRRSQLHVITPQLHPSMSDLKTLFLIRHAESLENERIGCLQRSISNVGRLSLPRLSDLRRSVELINVPAQVDRDVSAVGWDQVRWRDNFIR